MEAARLAADVVDVKRRAMLPEMRRAVSRSIHVKQTEETERRLSKALAPVFVEQVREMADGLGELAGEKSTHDTAAGLVGQVFNPEDPRWHDKIVDAALPVLAVGMAESAVAHLLALGFDIRKGTKQTTASRWLAEHPGDIEKLEQLLAESGLDASVLTELPSWMKQNISDQLTETFAQPYWKDIHLATAGDAEDYLRRGLEEGWSIRRMADAMSQSFQDGTGKYAQMRATRIARTECLPGDTVVDGARVVAAYKRWYSGPFIEIVTKAGRKFSGTPNHPVLTLRGWVGLGDLQEPDGLVCCNRRKESSSLSGDLDIETPPPTVSEIFDSLAAVGVLERRCTTKPDFHGDGMEGEVDVLTPDGELSYGNFIPVEESGIEKILPESDFSELLLVAKGNLFPRGIGELGGLCAAANHPPVSGYESANVSIIDSKCPSNIHGGLPIPVPLEDTFGMRSELGVGAESGIKQQAPGSFETSPGDASPFAGTQYGGSVAVENPSNLDTAHAGQVEIDHPLSIRRIESWSGHVFNLTTRDGYFSIAEGLYTGNSGHALNSARKASLDGLLQDLPPEASDFIRPSWLSVLGNTTRDTHAALDGVPADDNGLWNLAGTLVPWPGHISLPAGERINCMCSISTEFGLGKDEARQMIQDYEQRTAEGEPEQ